MQLVALKAEINAATTLDYWLPNYLFYNDEIKPTKCIFKVR
jgi:hypothetical protein